MVESSQSLVFKKSFFTDRFSDHASNQSSYNKMVNGLYFLMLEDLGDKGESLFGVIASEILNLQEYMFVVEG